MFRAVLTENSGIRGYLANNDKEQHSENTDLVPSPKPICVNDNAIRLEQSNGHGDCLTLRSSALGASTKEIELKLAIEFDIDSLDEACVEAHRVEIEKDIRKAVALIVLEIKAREQRLGSYLDTEAGNISGQAFRGIVEKEQAAEARIQALKNARAASEQQELDERTAYEKSVADATALAEKAKFDKAVAEAVDAYRRIDE